jgi:hypothetical protein
MVALTWSRGHGRADMVQASAKGNGELNSSDTVLCQSWKHRMEWD